MCLRKTDIPTRALLEHLSPSLTMTVHHTSTPLPPARRILHLRGPAVLFHKLRSSLSPSAADKLLVLRPDIDILPIGSHFAHIVAGRTLHKIRFSTSTERDSFLRAARGAAARAGRPAADYAVLRELGHGASATIYLVQRKSDGARLTLKAIDKRALTLSPSLLRNAMSERVALGEAADAGSAFVVRLVDAFETTTHFCLVTELADYGDLARVLRAMPGRRFEETVARQLFAEMVVALEEIHRMGFLYRDMKLESVLLNQHGHVRLADLGLVKRVDIEYEGSSVSSEMSVESRNGDCFDDDEPFRLVGRSDSFVGTRKYMSPEHLLCRRASPLGYGAAADVWALGVTLYIMLVGDAPFGKRIASRNAAGLFHSIKHDIISYPEWLSYDARNLLEGLLDRDSLTRLDVGEIKVHPWMKKVDWLTLKASSRKGILEKSVVTALQAQKLESVDDDLLGICQESEGFTLEDLMDLGPDSSSRRTRKLEGFEVLGFSFSPSVTVFS